MQVKHRLDALTTLRFFAASLIVHGHSDELFGLFGIAGFIPFNQGVSFFFILSGFILTWNYPSLTTWAQRRQFWLARFARIWPLHLVTCALWIALVYQFDKARYFPGSEGWLKLAANALLLQTWIPLHDWVLSFNGVAWSLSAEVFFYAMFPLLIASWRSHWHRILLLGAALVAGMTALAPHTPFGPLELLYFLPLARIFEFTVGMGLAHVCRSLMALDLKLARGKWFALELAALWFVVISLLAAANTGGIKSALGDPAALQYAAAGLWPAWAMLVGVFALSQGPIASLFSRRFAVFLGEISFALYLCHALLIHYLQNYPLQIEAAGGTGYVLYWCTALLFAALLFIGIEAPARKMILSRAHGGSANGGLFAIIGTKEIAAFLGLVALSSALYFGKPSNITPLDSASVAKFLASDRGLVPVASDIVFDQRYEFQALQLEPIGGQKVKVHVLLRARTALKATDILGLHVNRSDGTILAVFDRQLDFARAVVPAGTLWIQTYTLPADKLRAGTNLGFALYRSPGTLFDVAGGNSDWGGKRLIVPFKIDPQ